MSGLFPSARRWLRVPIVLSAVILLAACEEVASSGLTADEPAAVMTRTERDVERPDLFSVTDRALWDGRPSLGGIWVAHPDVREPERVVIRNTANGQSTIGALFRRERANPGPVLQLSSDAAEALGILAGAPTELAVVALRREEVAIPTEAPTEAPEAPLAATEIASTPLPAAAAPEAPDAAAAPAETPKDVGAAPSTVMAEPDGAVVFPPAPLVQVGVFGVRANADAAATALQSSGFTASVIPLRFTGRGSWRVIAGPVPDQDALARIRALGFDDAYFLQNQT